VFSFESCDIKILEDFSKIQKKKLVEFTLERKFPKLSQKNSQILVKIGLPKKTTGSSYLSSV
jgi:hypothetical protein